MEKRDQKKVVNQYRSRTVPPKVEGLTYDPIVQHRDFSRNENHNIIIVDSTKENVQLKIDAAAKDAGLENILKRIMKDHDVLAFERMSMRDDQACDSRVLDDIDVNSLNINEKEIVNKHQDTLDLLGVTKDDLLKMNTQQINELVNRKANEIMLAQQKKEGDK